MMLKADVAGAESINSVSKRRIVKAFTVIL